MRSLLPSLLVLASATAQASAQEPPPPYVCTASEKHACNMGSGCVGLEPNTWAIIDVKAGTYERCNAKDGCDRYQATFTMSGQTLNVEIPGKATFLKMLPGGGFSEVASQGTIALVSYGYCKLKQ